MPVPICHASEGWHPEKLMQYYRLDASLRWHDISMMFSSLDTSLHWHGAAL